MTEMGLSAVFVEKDGSRIGLMNYKGKGVAFNLEPIQVAGGVKVAMFKDPEGVQIELVEYP